MSEKRPLDAMEEMVNTLPPLKKKPRKKKPKKVVAAVQSLPPAVEYLSPPPPAQQEQEQALANLLDSLITTEPIPSIGASPILNIEPTVEVVQEKHYDWNVCPFHKCNLIVFEARTDGESYIKCQVSECPIFSHQHSVQYYMINVYEKLHESYLNRSKSLICKCEETVSLRVSKTEANPGRPYFSCGDCRFFQWADVELSKRNKMKQYFNTKKRGN